MSLNLLLVEDEPGIREGLASFLQLKGYRVVAAGGCVEGLHHLERETFDLVITDWHLGDGVGEEIVHGCDCPVLVISGAAEAVEVPGRTIEMIRKPVLPGDLVAQIERMLAADEVVVEEAECEPLPLDTADRVALIQALIRARHESRDEDFTVLDDGVYVTVQAMIQHDDDALQEDLGKVGGDVRCLDRDGLPMLEVRFFRTSQRDEADVVIGPQEPWPDGGSTIAVDFHGTTTCSPERFVELLHRARRVRETGRTAYFLNVPPHLRLHVELLGKAHGMPMREVAGPSLPEVLSQLWR